ncbi:2Fe-2S iron-sulfur cluster-binding protein [Gulbenkiania mobilis]|uniref:Ferredoxin n=1 Tax=Gulbenkiania mobilis TaxID=397457 RepID=A0ABY2CVJ2_GULMO|nr:2Fe-2S iron-sulfur cluster binding domain-containing protein [Gulbenkiania mobilis]TCW30819.1 ferredoxin [Gulbenkiania mobilis]
MTCIRFIDLTSGHVVAEVDAMPGDLLLDVARFHDLPLHWRCGQGTCGTCRVHVRHAAQPAVVEVGRRERNVLLRAGLVDAARAGATQWPDVPETWRLACYLEAGETPFDVLLPAPDTN